MSYTKRKYSKIMRGDLTKRIILFDKGGGLKVEPDKIINGITKMQNSASHHVLDILEIKEDGVLVNTNMNVGKEI